MTAGYGVVWECQRGVSYCCHRAQAAFLLGMKGLGRRKSLPHRVYLVLKISVLSLMM